MSSQKTFNAYIGCLNKLNIQVFSSKTYFKKYKSQLSKILKNFDPNAYFYFEIHNGDIVQTVKDNPDITDYELLDKRDREVI